MTDTPLPQDRFLTETETSALLNIPIGTLRYWRQTKRELQARKFGRAVRYSLADIAEYSERSKRSAGDAT